MKNKFRSIGYRIFFLYVLLSIVNVSFIITIIYENQIDLISRNTGLETEKQVAGLIDSIKRFSLEMEKGYLFDLRSGGSAAKQIVGLIEPHVEDYLIFNEKGDVLLSSGKSVKPPKLYVEDGLRSMTTMTFAGKDYYLRTDKEREMMYFYIPLVDFSPPNSILLVTRELGGMSESLENLYSQAVYVLIVILFFHGVFAALLFRYIVYPIYLLDRGSRRLMNGDYSTRILLERDDEFGSLAETFNRMAESIHDNVRGLADEVEASKESKRKTEKSITMDQSTGLFNRYYMFERLREEINRARIRKSGTAFMLVEVDGSVEIDNIYGSQTSNIVLMEIAKTIRRTCADTDTVGRFEGLIFAVLSPESPPDHARKLAESIRLAIEERKTVTPDGEFSATVSIGVFHADADSLDTITDVNDIIGRTETAVRQAKQQGGNRTETAR
ncbi:MAG TPA: diguanylate cyclase [Spirochaetota bacterium]|nr:diguanylate cyclase [Spirochaetota bacterium]